MPRPKVFLLCLPFLFVARPCRAVDPALADAVIDADSTVRQGAYEKMNDLSDPEKVNLAAYLADQLNDSPSGERAAMGLCRLGDPGVPFLDQQARTSFPGAQFAVMGLLMGTGKGPDAVAAIIRNGDEAAVHRVLAVIAAAGAMPAVVGDEVKNLAQDPRFAAEAKVAQEAVTKHGKEQKSSEAASVAPLDQLKAALASPDVEQRRSAVRSLVGGAFDGDVARLLSQTASNASEDADVRFYSALALFKDRWGGAGGDVMKTLLEQGTQAKGDDVIPKLVAALQATGDAGKQALVEALDSGKIDRSTYDQIQSMLGGGLGEASPSSSASPWTPDDSGFKTRQSAADAFSKNR